VEVQLHTFLTSQLKIEVSGQLHALATLNPWSKKPQYPVDRRLGGPHTKSEHSLKRKNPPLPLLGIEPWLSCP